MCFNYTKRILFVGCADSFSSQPGASYNSLVPSLYALECSGYDLSSLDKIEVPESDENLGVFTIHSHASSNIVFCTFTTKVLIAALEGNKFKKFRIVERFSEGNVYQSMIISSTFCAYSPKEESFNVLTFEKKHPGFNLSSTSDSKQWPGDFSRPGGPFLSKYSYTIEDFKDDIKFALIDSNLGLMFVFRQEIFKCIITRNSLVLDDKIAVHSIMPLLRLLPRHTFR